MYKSYCILVVCVIVLWNSALVLGSCIVDGIDFSDLDIGIDLKGSDEVFEYYGRVCNEISEPISGCSETSLCAVYEGSGIPYIYWRQNSTYTSANVGDAHVVFQSDNGLLNPHCPTRFVNTTVNCGAKMNSIVLSMAAHCIWSFTIDLMVPPEACKGVPTTP